MATFKKLLNSKGYFEWEGIMWAYFVCLFIIALTHIHQLYSKAYKKEKQRYEQNRSLLNS